MKTTTIYALNKTPEKTKRFQTPIGVLESFFPIFQHPVELVPIYLSGIWKHRTNIRQDFPTSDRIWKHQGSG